MNEFIITFPYVTYGNKPTDKNIEDIADGVFENVKVMYSEYFSRSGLKMDHMVKYTYYGSFGVMDVLDYLTMVTIIVYGKNINLKRR